MDYIFAFAGIPQSIFPEIQKSFSRIAPGRCAFISRPHTKNTYNQSDIDYYSQKFAEHIGKDHHNKLEQTCFAILYVDYADQGTVNFIAAFTPHILSANISWKLDNTASKIKLAESKNQLLLMMKDITSAVKSSLDLLKKEILEKSKKTPLLLPLKNFSSDILSKTIQGLYKDIVNAEDKSALISNAIQTIQNNHPPQVLTGSKPCFVDNKKIFFTSPGKSLHGLSRPNTGHPDICLISANVRLGAKYPKAFHYDCVKENQVLTGHFAGCHEIGLTTWKGDPHLNISPNDHIRR